MQWFLCPLSENICEDGEIAEPMVKSEIGEIM